MNSTRGVIIALCGVAALVLVMRFRGAGGSPETSPALAPGVHGIDLRATDERLAGSGSAQHGAGGASTGSRPGAASAPGDEAAAPGSTRPGQRAGAERAAGGHRRLPPPLGSVRDGNALRGGEPLAGADGAAVGEMDPDELADSRKHRVQDLPEAGSPGTQTAEGAIDNPAPEDIPEVAYDGGPEHVFDTASRAEITDAGPIGGGAGTIAFWIEPQWEPNSQDNASFVQVGDSGLEIIKSGNMLRFQFVDGSGAQHGGNADIGDWQPGEWRHVAAAWNGGTLSLYVDGGQVFLNSGPPPPEFGGDTKLYVGSTQTNGAQAAAGHLSYLTVLNRDVSIDEVKQMFASGRAPTH